MKHGRTASPAQGPGSEEIYLRNLTGEEIRNFTVMASSIAQQGPGPRDAGTDIYNNRRIPAGYTYLSQLLVHDLVFHDTQVRRFDRLSRLQKLPRTPILDLDCIYGGGPFASPWLYEAPPADSEFGIHGPRYRLRLGRVRLPDHEQPSEHEGSSCRQPVLAKKYEDIPRVHCPIAGSKEDAKCRYDPLLADPRNDDTLILSQLVVLFIKLHNLVTCRLKQKGPPPGTSKYDFEVGLFERARAIVQHCYREIVIHDLARKLLNDRIYDQYRAATRKGISFPLYACSQSQPEFLTYALRCGHAMVRGDYEVNGTFSLDGSRGRTTEIGKLLSLVGAANDETPVAEDWVIEWSRFFFDPGTIDRAGKDAQGRRVNFSRPLVPQFSKAFVTSPRPIDSRKTDLAYTDLLRGLELDIPSGQRLAELYGIEPLAPEWIVRWLSIADNWQTIDREAQLALSGNTPLMFYLLCEAAAPPAEGKTFGNLGSTLLAELLFTAVQDADIAADEGLAVDCLESQVPRDMTSLVGLVEGHEDCDPSQP